MSTPTKKKKNMNKKCRTSTTSAAPMPDCRSHVSTSITPTVPLLLPLLLLPLAVTKMATFSFFPRFLPTHSSFLFLFRSHSQFYSNPSSFDWTRFCVLHLLLLTPLSIETNSLSSFFPSSTFFLVFCLTALS